MQRDQDNIYKITIKKDGYEDTFTGASISNLSTFLISSLDNLILEGYKVWGAGNNYGPKIVSRSIRLEKGFWLWKKEAEIQIESWYTKFPENS